MDWPLQQDAREAIEEALAIDELHGSAQANADCHHEPNHDAAIALSNTCRVLRSVCAKLGDEAPPHRDGYPPRILSISSAVGGVGRIDRSTAKLPGITRSKSVGIKPQGVDVAARTLGASTPQPSRSDALHTIVDASEVGRQRTDGAAAHSHDSDTVLHVARSIEVL